MDILTGLSAISQALGIAKQLREIDQGVDEAGFKLKLAELQTALADAKVSLSDARLLLSEKDEVIRNLQKQLDELVNGQRCPICRTGVLDTKAVHPDPHFGVMGVQLHDLECSNAECRHRERRQIDPNKR